jgi:hypothetical protein
MRHKLILLTFMSLLLAALSATDAEIVRDLEFYESMDALATDELETIEKMADDASTDEDNKDVSDEN